MPFFFSCQKEHQSHLDPRQCCGVWQPLSPEDPSGKPLPTAAPRACASAASDWDAGWGACWVVGASVLGSDHHTQWRFFSRDRSVEGLSAAFAHAAQCQQRWAPRQRLSRDVFPWRLGFPPLPQCPPSGLPPSGPCQAQGAERLSVWGLRVEVPA